MRITLEADYATRIVCCLSTDNKIIGARDISERMNITIRFTLKILRKLSIASIVKSYKGVNGGYKLAKSPSEISLKDVIECIDGPVRISKCLEVGYKCTLNSNKQDCIFHNFYDKVSNDIVNTLDSFKFNKI